jgi:hypothetical protein
MSEMKRNLRFLWLPLRYPTNTVAEVYTPIYIKKCYQSFYTSSSKFHTFNS